MSIERISAHAHAPGGIRAGRVAAVALAGLVLGLAGCTAPGSAPADTPDALLAQLQKERARIDQTTDAMMKRIDDFNASRKPGERTLQFSDVFNQEFTDEQKDVLNTLLAKEQDVSYKALLQQIVGDRATIQKLQDDVTRLEQTLPDTFVVAKHGDSQHDLAMTYLTQDAKLAPDKAKELLGQVDQTDELLPGNRVWFFYDPQRDTFRTYVTQGEADQTPLAVRRARQRKLVEERDAYQQERDTFKDEKDAAAAQRDAAQAQVADLEQVKAGLESDISDLTRTKTDLEAKVSELSGDLALRENSLYYHAADERTLKQQGVLSPVLKRLHDVKEVRYDDSLDLRQGTTITLQPQAFGLEKIRDVRLLPPIYREGRDFSVETADDHSGAKVVILDPDLFRGKEVVLAIRG